MLVTDWDSEVSIYSHTCTCNLLHCNHDVCPLGLLYCYLQRQRYPCQKQRNWWTLRFVRCMEEYIVEHQKKVKLNLLAALCKKKVKLNCFCMPTQPTQPKYYDSPCPLLSYSRQPHSPSFALSLVCWHYSPGKCLHLLLPRGASSSPSYE